MYQKIWIFCLLVLGVCLLMIPCSVFAQSQAKPEYLIRGGYTNPVNHPVTQTGYKFKELVESRSKGRIKVEIYPSHQLGSNKELAESVRAGTVQMTALAPSYMASLVRWFDVLSLPFLWSGPKEAWKNYDGWLGKKMSEDLGKKGVTIIAVNEGGFSHIENRIRPVEKVEDLKDLKIRVLPSPILLEAMRAMQAKPIVMDYKESFPSLESGAIDGIILPITYIWNSKFYEVVDYLSICGFFHFPMVTYMNKNFLDSLPADLKEIVLDSAKIAQDRQRVKVAEEEDDKLKLLKEKTKVKVNEVASSEIKRFRSRAKPAYEFAAKKYGKELVNKLEEVTAR